jgi:hypothetical protein
LSLGLTDLLAAGGGATIGSVPGAIAAVGVKKDINSPRTQSYIASKLASTGEKLLGTATPKVAEKVAETGAQATAKGMIKAQAPVRALQGLAALQPQQGTEQDMALDPQNPNSPFNPNSPNYNPALADPTGGVNSLSALMGAGSESPYSLEAAQADIARDPKNMDQYMKLYEFMNPEPKQKAPNATQISQANNAASALTDIQLLRDTLSNDSSVLTKAAIPGGSIARGLTGTTDFETARQNITDVIGKLRSGAALTNGEAARYLAMLPKFGDSQKAAMNKLDRLETLLSRYANPQGAAADTTDLQSLLMAQ